MGNHASTVRESLHNLERSHRAFRPKEDERLYIDLNRLPRWTPMHKKVPVFIAAPLAVLRRIQIDTNYDLVYEISYENQFYPTPYRIDCQVCCLVWILLKGRLNYKVACLLLRCANETVLFDVAREIWCRLRPKPLQFSERHYLQIHGYGIHDVLKHNLRIMSTGSMDNPQPFPAGAAKELEVMYKWRNLVAYLINQDLRRLKEGPMRETALYVLNKVQSYLLTHAFIYSELPVGDGRDPLYLMKATALCNTKFGDSLFKIATIISIAFSEFDGDWWKNYITGPRDQHWSLYFDELILLVDNVLIINCFEACSSDPLPPEVIIHKEDCTENPQNCWCKETRALQDSGESE